MIKTGGIADESQIISPGFFPMTRATNMGMDQESQINPRSLAVYDDQYYMGFTDRKGHCNVRCYGDVPTECFAAMAIPMKNISQLHPTLWQATP
jgi:hypothetical protein